VRVNQIVGDWKRNNLLAVDGQHVVTLLDRPALAAMASWLRTEAPRREV
jgi:hypothetical protein